MSQRYARLLNDQDHVEHFLSVVLRFDYRQLDDIIYRIVEGEKGIADIDLNAQTLNHTRFRDRKFKTEEERWSLRGIVIDELVNLTRPAKDDDIALGNGGAKSENGIEAKKQAFLVIGLPASGKSGICNTISDQYKALILDSDFAKRKLPEFLKLAGGATIVHEESSQIVFGFKENPENVKSLFELALESGYNIVLPKIGQDPKSMIALARSLKAQGYVVHLSLISLLKKDSVIRAIYRFHETKRYVPLGLIFDGYGNDPALTYYLIKSRFPELFDSYGVISTNVPKGETPICIDLTGENPAKLFPFKENILI